ncbi:MAG: hypothetical protein AVDCRST_MAG88-2022, partial [uncultured Thermomicrobiales bacterium]
ERRHEATERDRGAAGVRPGGRAVALGARGRAPADEGGARRHCPGRGRLGAARRRQQHRDDPLPPRPDRGRLALRRGPGARVVSRRGGGVPAARGPRRAGPPHPAPGRRSRRVRGAARRHSRPVAGGLPRDVARGVPPPAPPPRLRRDARVGGAPPDAARGRASRPDRDAAGTRGARSRSSL